MKNLALIFLFSFTGWNFLSASYHYELSWENPASRTYHVEFTTSPDAGAFTDFSLPLWRPGRYIIQDFSAAVSGFKASSEGKALSWKKTDKDTWQVEHSGRGNITVEYDFYAAIQDAGSSYLCSDYAYFNPANLFMFAGKRFDEPCTLVVRNFAAEWKAASSLINAEIHNEFYAPSYHDFIDSPTILSPGLHSFMRKIGETDYWFHFQGEYEGGKEAEDAFLNGAEKIIREQVAVFGSAPMKRYDFIYLLLPFNMRHAVEHSLSSCYALPLEGMKSAASVSSMFGITSHEFWHLWNVKRIRPAALWPYRYDEPQYTSLHWFSEGVTDYYADLMMARAGHYNQEAFLNELAGNLQALDNSDANRLISPALSSFDSWLSPSTYMNPHLRTSYYPLGYRVGLLMDLRIRSHSKGEKSLDDLMRYLYRNYYEKNLGVPEDGILKAVEEITGEDWNEFFLRHVEGTQPYSYEDYFNSFGLELSKTPRSRASWEQIGILKSDETGYGLHLASVLPGGDAEKAGMGDGDILLTLNGKAPALNLLSDWLAKAKPGDRLQLTYLNGSGKVVETSLTWTDTHRGFDYSLREKKNADAKQKELLSAWMSSLL